MIGCLTETSTFVVAKPLVIMNLKFASIKLITFKPNLQVWLCVGGSIVGVVILIWITDRLSPYSYRNNK